MDCTRKTAENIYIRETRSCVSPRDKRVSITSSDHLSSASRTSTPVLFHFIFKMYSTKAKILVEFSSLRRRNQLFHFPVYQKSHFQNEAKCKTFLEK